MKYIVTGNCGFVGSHLTNKLIEQGHTVYGIDNLSTGKKERLNPKAIFISKDILEVNGKEIEGEVIHGIFHLAALPRVPLSIEKPFETELNNVLCTIRVLEWAKTMKCKVVLSSSSSVYGHNFLKEKPTNELVPPAPMSPYAWQKLSCEQYAQFYYKFHAVDSVCLRYFNIYGTGMSDTGSYVPVMSVFKRQKAAGESLTIYGSGKQKRDFTHISDVIEANIRAMEYKKELCGVPFNVGGGNPVSINYVADYYSKNRKYLPERAGDPANTWADITLTEKILGWRPKVKFKDGIKEIL